MNRSRKALKALGVLVVLIWPLEGLAGTSSLSFSASGANGSGRTDQPGLSCAVGGSGASWSYDYNAALPGGALSSVPGELDLHLEIHSEGTGDPATYDGAWLAADSSYATIENGRGTVRLDLASGGQCGVDTLAFDGTTASGTGTWVASGTESYRDATGSGTFTFVASVGPGADNPFQLGLNGSSSVPDPSLSVEVVEAVREHGSESGSRHALVTFAVTNTGPGDAFGVGLLETTSSALNITPVSPVPDDLGDLLAGDTALVQVRYRFDRPACKTGERGCEFDSTLEVEMPDALDNAANFSSTVPVRIPTHSQG